MCAVAAFTSGSASPGCTVRVKLCDSHAPDANDAPNAAFTPAISVSVTLSLTRFGLSLPWGIRTRRHDSVGANDIRQSLDHWSASRQNRVSGS
jgi:hypothetical protein